MPYDNLDLSALIGSRLCHDLISPIGAIGNGVELLQMGLPRTPELQLIAQSVENATARVKFFRIAFGKAAQDHAISTTEASGILDSLSAGGRIAFSLDTDTDPDRAGLRSAFLAALCLETALPLGGRIDIDCYSGAWTLRASGPRLSAPLALETMLTGDDKTTELRPDDVQFLLFPASLVPQGRSARLEQTGTELQIVF